MKTATKSIKVREFWDKYFSYEECLTSEYSTGWGAVWHNGVALTYSDTVTIYI